MIADAAKGVLERSGRWSSDVITQVADMVSGAVDQALKRLGNPVPPFTPTFAQGGRYKFTGPQDNSPPANVGNVGKNAEPLDPAKQVDEVKRSEPETVRGDDGAVRWLL